MPSRLFLSSGDLMADRRFDFARDLQLKGDLAAAIEYGAAHGALAMTNPGDTSMATLAEVERLAKGAGARIRR